MPVKRRLEFNVERDFSPAREPMGSIASDSFAVGTADRGGSSGGNDSLYGTPKPAPSLKIPVVHHRRKHEGCDHRWVAGITVTILYSYHGGMNEFVLAGNRRFRTRGSMPACLPVFFFFFYDPERGSMIVDRVHRSLPASFDRVSHPNRCHPGRVFGSHGGREWVGLGAGSTMNPCLNPCRVAIV